MRWPSLLRIVALAASLAACSRPGPMQDIAWYRAHPEERSAQLAACRNDRGRLAPTASCIDALAADSEAVSKRFWTTPRPAPRAAKLGAL